MTTVFAPPRRRVSAMATREDLQRKVDSLSEADFADMPGDGEG